MRPLTEKPVCPSKPEKSNDKSIFQTPAKDKGLFIVARNSGQHSYFAYLTGSKLHGAYLPYLPTAVRAT